MGRKCCAIGCRSNYKNEHYVTVFTFPSDPERRNLWIRSLNRVDFSPSSTAVICIKHFEERFIVREDRAVRDDGSILIVPRQRLTLTTDAYPTIYENLPSYCTKRLPAKRKDPEKRRQELKDKEESQFNQWCSNDIIKTCEEFDKCQIDLNDNWINHCRSSFDWRLYFRKPKFVAAPVSCFKHVALSDCWDNIISGVYVEIRSPDCKTCCTANPCRYWIASVIKVAGYMGLLQFEGFDPHCGQKWINLCTEPHIHPVGWCVDNNKPLVPPKSIEDKRDDWKEFLMKKIAGSRTIPPNFGFKNVEQSNNIIKEGMKLEVVDKNLISVVRSAKVSQVVGGRLHVVYIDTEMEDEGFWCHERSPLIHPVGWAQIIGHALKGQPEYARKSLHKTLYRTFEPDDATWDMFLPVINPVRELQFKPGMKLEAIDPLNLSTICVATVTEVLRNNYLMIGIDGMMAANGSDCFCYHASSPCIFPVGFCEEHGIQLTPPRGYKGDFKWSEYLKKTKSEAAPVDLFHRDIPDHGFKERMYLEAVDLMEPRLICVAYITKVVGRLLRVHFEGWEDDYDQWCDCESPDLFPVGWCDVLGYKLEPPRVDPNAEDKKKKKTGKKKKRRLKSKKYSDEEDDDDDDSFGEENIEGEKPEVRTSKRRSNGTTR